jgi:hypothetical protein
MESIADQLPPDIAQQIHLDRRKTEADDWSVRDQLLPQYRGQWIGFADGSVIASPAADWGPSGAEATGWRQLRLTAS